MKVSRPCSGFHRMTDDRYSDTICAVCGWGIRQGEDTARDQNGKICHAACVEKEVAMNTATPDEQSVLDWTAREMRGYCAARIALQGGVCIGVDASSCQLFGIFGECPDQWKEPAGWGQCGRSGREEDRP